ncbi:hypothetical protein CHUAL_005553 [Chamberlinius hualienensis]
MSKLGRVIISTENLRKNQWNIWNCLYPLKLVLQLYGLNYVDRKSAKYPALQIFIQRFITAFFYTSFIIATSLTSLEMQQTEDFYLLSKQIAFISHHVATSIIYTNMVFQRQNLNTFFKKLSRFQRVMHKRKKFYTFLIAVTTVTPYIVSIAVSIRVDSIIVNWSFILGLTWIFFINPFYFFCFTSSSFFCYVINDIYNNLQNSLQTEAINSKQMSWDLLVTRAIEKHKKICELVKDFGQLYSLIYLTWCAIDLTLLIFLTRSVNLNKTVDEWYCAMIPTIFLIISCFVIKMLAAAQVNSKVISSLCVLSPPTIDTDLLVNTEKLNTILTNSQLSVYIQQVTSNPPAITAGSFFAINKATILSVGATVITYILVLYGNNI